MKNAPPLRRAVERWQAGRVGRSEGLFCHAGGAHVETLTPLGDSEWIHDTSRRFDEILDSQITVPQPVIAGKERQHI